MKRLWTGIVAVEIALLIAYAAWVAAADYRVVWLALVFVMFDLSLAAWINGVSAFRTSKNTLPWLSFLASIAVFVGACALLAIFVKFGIPQY